MPAKCFAFLLALCMIAAFGCQGRGPTEQALSADVPLHLEDHIDAARIEGCEVPTDIPEVFEWRFSKDMRGWKATVPLRPGMKKIKATYHEDALRLTLTKETMNPWGYRMGSVHVDLDDWNGDEWGFIVIQARTTDDITWMSPAFNLREKSGTDADEQGTFLYWGDSAKVINDGEVHTYLIRADIAWPEEGKHIWRQLGITVGSSLHEQDDTPKGPMSIDILSVGVIPKEAAYAKSKAGTGREPWVGASRRVLYTHVPGKLEYEVVIPEKGRLDVGLGLLKKNPPVKFKVSVRERGGGVGRKALLEDTCSDGKHRLQRSVDLSSLAGKTMTLILETEAERPGNIAFWGAPTLSGARATDKPNVVLYIIDGAAADYMSVYGYNRRTTPQLERLAAEGTVFENAHSNSSWTQVSVPSFMTSLHNSVLGGYDSESNPLPEKAVPMAERMHRAGYLTEVLTSNPYCGRMSSLDRGVDSMVDTAIQKYDPEDFPFSEKLHRKFWDFREAYPAEPYWVHFQPVDVHQPWKPVAPFAGLYATLEERRVFGEMTKKMEGVRFQSYAERIEKAGVDTALYSQISRKLYDESMAHQDHAIGKLVERIKDRGEWEKTLFIVAADHSHESAALPLLDPKLPKYQAPLLAAQVSRIPMIFVWAGKLPPGRRLTQPVSMIDMLPTILDLAGLPAPEMAQGQSLAPLLLGRPGYTPRPIVFDEFNIEDKYFYGSIEVIDGRWGASLRIDPRPDDKKTPMDRARPAPLMIFDIWEDPYAFKSLHAERPDLVEKYLKMLDGIWKEHKTLAKKFSRAGNVPLTPEQIETLRSLGYLR
jgi:arylsulfatase A-like enzyme